MEFPNNLKYFNISRNWKILNPVYESDEVKGITIEEMNCYRLLINKEYNVPLETGISRVFRYPAEFDSGDWRNYRIGRPPLYDRWICTDTCHFSVNIHMEVLTQVFPDIPWRIIKTEKHSTIFDGIGRIYDPIYQGIKWDIQTLVDDLLNAKDLVEFPVHYIDFHEYEDYISKSEISRLFS